MREKSLIINAKYVLPVGNDGEIAAYEEPNRGIVVTFKWY